MTSSWAVIDGQRPGSHPKASGRRWDGIWMGVVRGLHALLGPWAVGAERGLAARVP